MREDKTKPIQLDSHVQSKIIASHVAANASQPKFKIENSVLSSAMWCKEQVDGDIECELEYVDEQPELVTFSVEDLGMPKYDDPNYMGHEFDEKYIYQFTDANSQETAEDDFGAFAGVIEMACNDYDEFNYAVMCLKAGGSQE